MAEPMPATWRRLPLATPEFELYWADGPTRNLWYFGALVHHQKTKDHVVGFVTVPCGQNPEEYIAKLLESVPNAYPAPRKNKKFEEILNELFFPALFTAYGFDRKLFAQELRRQLPPAVHQPAQRAMRHFLAKLLYGRRFAPLRNPPTPKKPWVFREKALRVGRALYRLAHKLDTWLWEAQKRHGTGTQTPK